LPAYFSLEAGQICSEFWVTIFVNNPTTLYFQEIYSQETLRNRSVGVLQKQAIVFIVAGLMLWLVLSGLLSPALYLLPLAVGIALVVVSFFLETKQRGSGIKQAFVYPQDEDLV
jgi:hypothetical protein